MTTIITGAARSNSWNIELFIEDKAIAGVFQRNDLLTIADLAHELELCFIIDQPDGWQLALLPKATESADHSLIILDYQDETPLPTPSEVDHYTFIFHSSSRCKSRDRHSLEGIVYTTCSPISAPQLTDFRPLYSMHGDTSATG